MPNLYKNPDAWLPAALSLMVIVMMLFGFALHGAPVRQPDEGTAAHLFQIWLVLEFFMVVYFAMASLPKNPKQGAIILSIQIAAVLIGCSPVYYFKL